MNISDAVSDLFSDDEEVQSCLASQIVSRRSDGNYLQRLVIVWNERFEQGTTRQRLQHVFAAGIDTKNQVYIDCKKRLIYAKILLSTLFRPIFGTALTLYSLSMIPIFKAIASTCSGKITSAEAFHRSVKSLADIVRIPLYEVVMIVVGCAALLIGPLAPSTLYRFRELIGKIERSKCYGEFEGGFALTPCFQSRQLKQMVNQFGFGEGRLEDHPIYVRNFLDIDYGDHSIEKIQEFLGEENFGRLFIRQGDAYFLQQSFNQTIHTLNPEQLNQLKNSFAQRALTHYARSLIKSMKNRGFLRKDAVYTSFAVPKISVEAIQRIRESSTRSS